MLSTSYLGTCGDFRPLSVSRQYEKQQVPTGSTSYVGTCSPTSVQCKHQSLQLSESVLTCFTTPLWSIKYLHVPLELRDFALFGGLETWSIPIRLEWRKSFSCWTAAFWTAAFKVWGKMKRCKAEGVSKFENEENMKLAELAEDSSWCPFSFTSWRLIVRYKIGTWFHSAPNLRAGVKMKWTLQPAVPSCFWHIQQSKTNRISRFDRENGRFRQVPPHMLALVAQLLSNANISHCSSQNRFWHVSQHRCGP